MFQPVISSNKDFRGANMKRRGILFLILSAAFLWPVFGGAFKTYRIRKIGKSPNFIALDHSRRKIYVTSWGTSEFLAVDLNQKIVTQSVNVGAAPLGFAIADHDKTALVACKDAGTIAFVDLQTFRVTDELRVGGSPNFVAVSPMGYRAYATNYGRTREGQVHIIDVRERSVLATIKVGAAPFGVVISPTTEMVYVLVGGNNEVWVIDPDRQTVVQKIAVGEAPDGIAITPDGKRIFVANSQSNDLSVIDTQLMRVLITIPIGKKPFGVAVSPDGKRVFVVNSGSRNVSIVPADLSSLDFDTFEVERNPTDIKVGQDNRTVYVVNEMSNSIVVTEIP
jgi:YVTN family beta-propeller protein